MTILSSGRVMVLMLNYEYPLIGGGGSNACTEKPAKAFSWS